MAVDHPKRFPPDAPEEQPEDRAALAQSGAGRMAAIKRSLRPVMMLITAVFVVLAGWRLVKQWDTSQVTIHYGWLAAGVVPMLIAVAIQGLGWIALVERMAGRRIPKLSALVLYMESQLARYAPGRVGLPLVRIAGAPKLGVERGVAGASVLIEVGAYLVTGGALGMALLYVVGRGAEGVMALIGDLALPVLALGVVVAGLLAVVDRAHLPSKLRPLAGPGLGPIMPLRLLSIEVVYWGLWGVHGALLALAFGAGMESLWAAAAATVLAPLVGFLALVAPAGAGVREAMFSVALEPFVGAAPALCVALASRAISLASDFGVWLLLRRLAGNG